MKRNLVLMGIVLLVSSSEAQITLNSSDFFAFYAVGSSHLVYQTDSAKTTMDVGTASRNSQSWVLPSIILQDTTVLANGAAGGSTEFPNATHVQVAVYQAPGRKTWHYYYFHITNDSLVKLGEYVYTQAAGNPRPSTTHYCEVGALFPTMWGLSFAWRDSSGSATNGVITNGAVSVDAYGTITALNASYQCLRLKKLRVRTYYGYLQSPDTSVEFDWLTKEGIFITAQAQSPSQVSGTVPLGAVSYTKVISAPSVSVNKEYGSPVRFALYHNYPNPFNPSTMLQYGLPVQSRVHLIVYNTLGQVVADLVNTEQAAGWNQVVWNANVASGLYFYRIEAVSLDNPIRRFVDVKKMILVK